ncbi:MAG: MATE family efflux transporter, partial [Armatimonadota bacterium]
MPDEGDLGASRPLPEETMVSEDFEPMSGVSTPVTPETTERKRVDLTQGNLLRGIVMLSWPIVTGAFLNWIMGMADIKMVGRLGPEAIAAVGLAQPVIYTILAIIFAVATGTQVLVARYTGARQDDRVAEVTRQTIIVAVLAGLILIPIGRWLAEPALRLMGAEGLVLQYGVAYT